ncbi:CopG family transcriptional regulator [Mesorhizobium sp. ZMM04-4]
MRTTLAIDDDVLMAAKAIADQQDRSLGDVISDLARKSLRKPQPPAERNGVPLLGVFKERWLKTGVPCPILMRDA